MNTEVSGKEFLDVDEQRGNQRMTALCESFPVLRDKPGTDPWNQETFARWASGPAPTHASRLAAAFVLSVWSGRCDEPCWNKRPFRVGKFDVIEAFGCWDSQQKAAFNAWCRDPFFP